MSVNDINEALRKVVGDCLNFIGSDTPRTTAYLGIAILLFLLTRLTPTLDAREPPLLKPSVPVIGHLIGLLRDQTRFLWLLGKKQKPSIATLPILGGKVYAVWEPSLIQATFRNPQLSLLPLATEFALKQLNLSKETAHTFKTTDLVPDFFNCLHPSLSGKYLPTMNRSSLDYMSEQLNGPLAGSKMLEFPSFYKWLRDLMTMATAEGLYGSGNVFRGDQQLLEDVWIFEAGLPQLTSRPFPHKTAAKAWAARERVMEALARYYKAKLDDNDDVGQIVRARADVLRRYGMPDEEVGQFEVGLFHVATSNTIPTLFWFAAYIFSRKDLVAQLREEIENLVQKDGDVVTIDTRQVEEKCPLLVRCYKESMRLSSHAFHFRRALEETTVSDGSGHSYLFKKDVDVQFSAYVSHTREDTWGPDPTSFEPDRFLPSASDKSRRAAYHPFGGGRHLCPGRSFATTQILSFVAAILVGFDVWPLEGEDAPWKLPAMAKASFSEAAAKPERDGEGFGVRIRRREGWEDVKWVYKC